MMWVDLAYTHITPVIIIGLLKYLKGTIDWGGLHYGKFPAILEGYRDANWVSDNNEINSTSGYVFTLGGGYYILKIC